MIVTIGFEISGCLIRFVSRLTLFSKATMQARAGIPKSGVVQKNCGQGTSQRHLIATDAQSIFNFLGSCSKRKATRIYQAWSNMLGAISLKSSYANWQVTGQYRVMPYRQNWAKGALRGPLPLLSSY